MNRNSKFYRDKMRWHLARVNYHYPAEIAITKKVWRPVDKYANNHYMLAICKYLTSYQHHNTKISHIYNAKKHSHILKFIIDNKFGKVVDCTYYGVRYLEIEYNEFGKKFMEENLICENVTFCKSFPKIDKTIMPKYETQKFYRRFCDNGDKRSIRCKRFAKNSRNRNERRTRKMEAKQLRYTYDFD